MVPSDTKFNTCVVEPDRNCNKSDNIIICYFNENQKSVLILIFRINIREHAGNKLY